jgi:multicomponent Na+:H+ antiporter subunit E
MITTISLFSLWYFVWLLLAWPPRPISALIGIPVAVFVTAMTVDFFREKAASSRKASRYLWFGYYVLLFSWECLKANIDVAYRVLHPDLPIRPGTIRVKTSLKTDTGLTFLANSITLTPGTTTVDIDKENGIIYIHWIYVPDGYDVNSMRLRVVEKFETVLRRIFE